MPLFPLAPLPQRPSFLALPGVCFVCVMLFYGFLGARSNAGRFYVSYGWNVWLGLAVQAWYGQRVAGWGDGAERLVWFGSAATVAEAGYGLGAASGRQGDWGG